MVREWKQSKGQTIIYVGDGKGKTTAAIGMAVRALGHGWRVFVLQFMKEEAWPSGERDFLHALSSQERVWVRSKGEVMIETVGEGFVGIMGDKKQRATHKAAADAGYKRALEILTAGQSNNIVSERPPTGEAGSRGATVQYQLVILDEILSAVDEGLLTEDQILELMEKKPDDLTLVMTGHKQYPKIFEKADLVTEMKKIKHPFDAGYIAKKGIDY